MTFPRYIDPKDMLDPLPESPNYGSEQVVNDIAEGDAEENE